MTEGPAPPPTPAPGAEVIRARGLEVGYRDRVVWKDAEFEVRRGEFVAVIGPNGAGKTTLFRMLLGTQRSRKGTLSVFGAAPRRGNPRVGYVPQHHTIDRETHIDCESLVRLGLSGSGWRGRPSRFLSILLLEGFLSLGYWIATATWTALPPVPLLTLALSRLPEPHLFGWLVADPLVAERSMVTTLVSAPTPAALALGVALAVTAFWAVGLGRRLLDGAGREKTATWEALRAVGGEELARKPLGSLSGGELQRIFLAEAMAGAPEMLLLDEPLSNLDLRRSRELVDLVAGVVSSRNVTTLLVAHDINPLIQRLDKVIYIANGKVATGAPEEVLTSERLSALYEVPVEVLHDSRGNLVIVGAEEGLGGEGG